MNTYLYQAAFLCERCGQLQRESLIEEGKAPSDIDNESSYDSDDFPKGPYSDGGGEADTPQHCDHCETFLENPLTSDGIEYVREQIARSVGRLQPSIALREWEAFYKEELTT